MDNPEIVDRTYPASGSAAFGAGELDRLRGSAPMALLRLRAAACHKGTDEVVPQPGRPQGSRHRGPYRRDRGRDRAERLRQEHLLQPRHRLSPRADAGRVSSTAAPIHAPSGRRRSRGSASPAPSRARGSFPQLTVARERAGGGPAAPSRPASLDALVGTPPASPGRAARSRRSTSELLDLVGLAGSGARARRRPALWRPAPARAGAGAGHAAAAADAGRAGRRHGRLRDARAAAPDRRHPPTASAWPSSWSSTTWT